MDSPTQPASSRDGRELTTAERFALADVHQQEAKWNGLVDRVKRIENVDQRQVAIAVTEAEGAFMRLARAIARPERVASAEEALRDPAFVAALEAFVADPTAPVLAVDASISQQQSASVVENAR